MLILKSLKSLKSLKRIFQLRSSDAMVGNNNSQLASDPRFAFLSGQAEVDEVIQPGRAGRIKINGTWWYAQCSLNIMLGKGATVHVVGINNITLLVEPIANS
jgi:membrane protein implicated in regulation of membrane protease activity